jgi:hypothetical protein
MHGKPFLSLPLRADYPCNDSPPFNFRTSAAKDAAAAKRLEQKATEAQARAEALCTKANSAAANAEAIEASQ